MHGSKYETSYSPNIAKKETIATESETILRSFGVKNNSIPPGKSKLDTLVKEQNVENQAMDGLTRERFILRSKLVLEDAWLINQELSLIKNKDGSQRHEIEGPELEKMQALLDAQDFENLEMNALKNRRRMVEGDRQFAVTTKAGNSFEQAIKAGKHLSEEDIIAKHINSMLADTLHSTQYPLFKIPTSEELDCDHQGALLRQKYEDNMLSHTSFPQAIAHLIPVPDNFLPSRQSVTAGSL